MPNSPRPDEYTVAWICTYKKELAMAMVMLDEIYELNTLDVSGPLDIMYGLGSIGGHKIVLVCPPHYPGNLETVAAIVAQMSAAFKAIQLGLIVGHGGGVPSSEIDIRLGDVVVGSSGVIQYDLGAAESNDIQLTGSLNLPPKSFLDAVIKESTIGSHNDAKLLKNFSELDRNGGFGLDRTGPDILFDATYDHEGGGTCDSCTSDRQVVRQPRETGAVKVHHGRIASGNGDIRDGRTRDRVSRELGGILCFDEGAAGLTTSFPCLMIRGICDYADSHKDFKWESYASGVATAYAKALLLAILPVEVAQMNRAENVTKGSRRQSNYPSPSRILLRINSHNRSVFSPANTHSSFDSPLQAGRPLRQPQRTRRDTANTHHTSSSCRAHRPWGYRVRAIFR
jgi:nucleoside phosphorylase